MSKKNKKAAAAAIMPEKVYNFCGKKRMILGIVVAVFVAFVIGIIVRGVNFALEFKGGTMMTYSYVGDIDTNKVESTAKQLITVPVNVRTGENLSTGDSQLSISFTSDDGFTADKQSELTKLLQKDYADNKIELFDSNDVNPTTGREFLIKCLIAVLFAAVVVIIYIAIRFRNIGGWSAGVCSVFALCHDLLAAIAASVIFGFEVNTNTVAVLLTILGYSINNTIVIYDRIRENRKFMPKASLNELINVSCTQSLTRSIRTSVTTISTMLIITIVVLVTGFHSLLSFSVPLMFGLISGTYSSIFVAPVTWSWWKNKAAAKNSDKKKK